MLTNTVSNLSPALEQHKPLEPPADFPWEDRPQLNQSNWTPPRMSDICVPTHDANIFPSKRGLSLTAEPALPRGAQNLPPQPSGHRIRQGRLRRPTTPASLRGPEAGWSGMAPPSKLETGNTPWRRNEAFI